MSPGERDLQLQGAVMVANLAPRLFMYRWLLDKKCKNVDHIHYLLEFNFQDFDVSVHHSVINVEAV